MASAETKHTPGPWAVADEHPDGVLDRSIVADGYYVATVHDTSFAGDCWDADAHLIAAAPDMLEALLAAEEARQEGILNMSVEAVERVHTLRRAAIAKATGGAN
jgi:hypothetical protein